VYTCGRNVEGQLGYVGSKLSTLLVNERGHRYQPVFSSVNHEDLLHRKVKQVYGGGEFTLLQLQDQELLVLGTTIMPNTATPATTSAGATATSLLARNPTSAATSTTSIMNTNNASWISFFQVEHKVIHQIGCGFGCVAVVVKGYRQPLGLQTLCAKVIRHTPYLYYPIYAPATSPSTSSSTSPTTCTEEQGGEDWDDFEPLPSASSRLPRYLQETIQSLM